GPITRAQAKFFKEILNGLMKRLWDQAQFDPGTSSNSSMVQVIQAKNETSNGFD
ncbi:hypothetical protein J1N35_041616, partial [Gossypium stocksii]